MMLTYFFLLCSSVASRAYVVTLLVNDDLSKKSRLRLSGIVFADLVQGLESIPSTRKSLDKQSAGRNPKELK